MGEIGLPPRLLPIRNHIKLHRIFFPFTIDKSTIMKISIQNSAQLLLRCGKSHLKMVGIWEYLFKPPETQ